MYQRDVTKDIGKGAESTVETRLFHNQGGRPEGAALKQFNLQNNGFVKNSSYSALIVDYTGERMCSEDIVFV